MGDKAAEAGDIRVEARGAAASIVLTRPQALNALTDDMRTQIANAMPGFSRDPMIYGMVIRADGDKAFCAGGDVRQLVGLAKTDMTAARRSFADEYRLNWRLECFSKPTVSLINGAVMGSGVGLTLYGTHRVAGADYQFAMPEVAIGLFPDVGVSHHLARLPHEIGTYLALTGAPIGRADAFALGLVTHCIDASHFDQIHAAMADADPVDAKLDPLHVDPGPSHLLPRASVIAPWFAGDDAQEIVNRVRVAAESDGPMAAFAQETLSTLMARSPLSLCVTLRHLRQATDFDLRETLMADYTCAFHFLNGHDFAEGVRAMLIDKDKAPQWRPSRLDDVGADLIASYFQTPDDGGLMLETRQEMQRLRV